MRTRNAPTIGRAIAVALLFGPTMTRAGEPTTDLADAARHAGDSIRAAIAIGDAAAVEARLAATNADEALLRPAVAGDVAAIGAFGAALTARFGPAATGHWGVAPAATTAPVVGIETVREGNGSRVTFAGVATLLRARGVDFALPADEPLRRLIERREALGQVIADVRAGTFPTAAAASDAAQRAWADASRGANAQ